MFGPQTKRMGQAHSVLDLIGKVKMLVLDVDGVLTDGKLYYNGSQTWVRSFHILDGMGIKRLQEKGYQVAVITGSKSEDIRERMKVLGIQHFFEGSIDKVPALQEISKRTGLDFHEMAYMGDDYFDAPVLEKVGFSATVPEAVEEAMLAAKYVTKRSGGAGAVREVCDLILKYGAIK